MKSDDEGIFGAWSTEVIVAGAMSHNSFAFRRLRGSAIGVLGMRMPDNPTLLRHMEGVLVVGPLFFQPHRGLRTRIIGKYGFGLDDAPDTIEAEIRLPAHEVHPDQVMVFLGGIPNGVRSSHDGGEPATAEQGSIARSTLTRS